MEIFETLSNLNETLHTFLLNAGMWAPLISSILIVFEGIFAFLPLCVFVTLNVLTLGTILGSSISWICTVFGCFLAFFLCRIGLSPLFQKFIKNTSHLKNFMKVIDNISFSKLVLIISIPFSPSFFVNIAAGLSKIPKKKFLYALLLGKTSTIIFWGILGSSLVDCLTNPIELIKVIFIILLCDIISRLFNKKFNIDEIFEEKNFNEQNFDKKALIKKVMKKIDKENLNKKANEKLD